MITFIVAGMVFQRLFRAPADPVCLFIPALQNQKPEFQPKPKNKKPNSNRKYKDQNIKKIPQ